MVGNGVIAGLVAVESESLRAERDVNALDADEFAAKHFRGEIKLCILINSSKDFAHISSIDANL